MKFRNWCSYVANGYTAFLDVRVMTSLIVATAVHNCNKGASESHTYVSGDRKKLQEIMHG